RRRVAGAERRDRVAGATRSRAALLLRKNHVRGSRMMTGAFLEFSRSKLVDEYWPRMRTCVESLTEEQVWWRPNEASNSVGNLLLHLHGNVQQWLGASFTRDDDARDRPAEFAARAHVPSAALLRQLDATVQQASAVLQRLTEADLTA